MPELPEVKTTTDHLKKKIIGYKIEKVFSDWPKYQKIAGKDLVARKVSFKKYQKEVEGFKIQNIKRVGKNIFFILAKNKQKIIWHAHMKMTGHFLVFNAREYQVLKQKIVPIKNKKNFRSHPLGDRFNRYIHFYLKLEKADRRLILAFSDLRKFGKMVLYPIGRQAYKKVLDKILAKEKIGPDVWNENLTGKQLKKFLTKRKTDIRRALLDQSLIAGIGNIYTDEILFKAKISPMRKTDKILDVEFENLISSTKKVLEQAIKLKGTSKSDYRVPSGKKGRFQEKLRVYQKEGELCPNCQIAKIKKMKVGGRHGRYCPRCQK